MLKPRRSVITLEIVKYKDEKIREIFAKIRASIKYNQIGSVLYEY